MKSQRQEIEEKTHIWISYADEDLSTAQVGLTLINICQIVGEVWSVML